jgi:hypothetical protein
MPQEEVGLLDSRLRTRCRALTPAVETRITCSGRRGLAVPRGELAPERGTERVPIVWTQVLAGRLSESAAIQDAR